MPRALQSSYTISPCPSHGMGKSNGDGGKVAYALALVKFNLNRVFKQIWSQPGLFFVSLGPISRSNYNNSFKLH